MEDLRSLIGQRSPTDFTISDDGNVGIGTTAPTDKLHVSGTLRVNSLGAPGATPLCRNASNQIATCSALRHSEENISPRSGDQMDAALEQQRRIELLESVNATQQKQIDEQRDQIEILLRLACSQTSEPTVCRQ